jgi:hypothetical protein
MITIVPGVTKYKCPYCDSDNYLFESQAPPSQPKDIKQLIPIKVEQRQLHSLILSKMIEHDLAPDDILTNSVIQEESLMYVPCYVAKGTFDINWTASFGYDRQESYVTYETYYENGRSRTRPVTRYRTVTDWRPASGKANGEYLAIAYAGSNLSKNAISLVQGLPTSLLMPYTPAFVENFTLEPFSKNPDDVREPLNDAIYRQEYAEVASHFQGDRQRDVHFDSKRKSDYIQTGLLPAAHAVFAYKDKQYNLWADAYDLTRITTDLFPQDKSRSSKVSRGLFPLICSIIALFLFWYFEHFNVFGLAGPLLGMIYYFWRKRSILGYSKKIRESTLAQKKLDDYDQVGHLSDEEVRTLEAKTKVNDMPFLAHTSMDFILIPFLCILFSALASLLPYLID